MQKQIINNIACYKFRTFNNEAETILWLHGYTLHSAVWKSIFPKIAEYNNVAIDIPGHGNSCSIDCFQSLPELGEAVNAVLEQFNIDHIIGFSFGGILGLQLAVQFPKKFKSLTLISSPLGGTFIDDDAQKKNWELIELFNKKGKGAWLTKCWLQSPPEIFSGIKKHPQAFNDMYSIIEEHSWEELNKNSFSIFTRHNQYNSLLKKMSSKVFLLIGENDMEYIKRCNQVLFKTIDSCKRIYVPECGHLPLLESPDIVIRIIKDNLSSLRSDNSA